jgi:excisionase family DNA binding protein
VPRCHGRTASCNGVADAQAQEPSLQIRLSDDQLEALATRIAIRLQTPEPNRWLSTAEAAEYVGCHPVTMRKAAAERRVPFAQDGPGCALRFLRSDLDKFRRGSDGGYSTGTSSAPARR